MRNPCYIVGRLYNKALLKLQVVSEILTKHNYLIWKEDKELCVGKKIWSMRPCLPREIVSTK